MKPKFPPIRIVQEPKPWAAVYVWIALVLMGIAVAAFSYADTKSTGRHFLELELNNPYRFGVELEVKCDWNNDKKDFEFRKIYFIKPGKSLNIRFPKYYSQCQVWPSHAWHWVEGERK